MSGTVNESFTEDSEQTVHTVPVSNDQGDSCVNHREDTHLTNNQTYFADEKIPIPDTDNVRRNLNVLSV